METGVEFEEDKFRRGSIRMASDSKFSGIIGTIIRISRGNIKNEKQANYVIIFIIIILGIIMLSNLFVTNENKSTPASQSQIEEINLMYPSQ